MTKLTETRDESHPIPSDDIIGDLESLGTSRYNILPALPLTIPDEEVDKLVLLFENFERHYVRWLKTGKRYVAQDDYEKFKTYLFELIDKYGG